MRTEQEILDQITKLSIEIYTLLDKVDDLQHDISEILKKEKENNDNE